MTSAVPGLCSSTPRGDGNLAQNCVITSFSISVYAAQPREGTETFQIAFRGWGFKIRFMQLNPARGRKRARYGLTAGNPFREVYAAQPREGTETLFSIHILDLRPRKGLCSSTPRGDGNSHNAAVISVITGVVYAAQPREGTETRCRRRRYRDGRAPRFMQLNPARGRKLQQRIPNPSISGYAVYAAQPREGTETNKQLRRLRWLWTKVYAAQPREGTETIRIISLIHTRLRI